MSDAIFTFVEGSRPLLISIPHDGRGLAGDMQERMSAAGRALPDTDWHVAQLYEFASGIGASVIAAKNSRYVVDLNRPPGDAALYENARSTGICPEKTFAGDDIYRANAGITEVEKHDRIVRYWRPYHDRIAETLASLRTTHGYGLLWDAHSIVSEVPALFDGELPVLNVGTYSGRSCAPHIEAALADVAAHASYSSVMNGRFTGGYITRHYGDPAHDVHAVQLELAQRCYMDEKTLRYDAGRSASVIACLQNLLQTYMASAAALYRTDNARRRK
jgi:N-formylglutamate amidohydrolase